MNILDTIVAQKRLEVARLPEGPVDVHSLREALRRRPSGRRDFIGALAKPNRGDIGLIAEVKKASPSAGIIRPDFDAVRIAQQYQEGGASCLSVLTDEKFFQGSLAYLRSVREAVALPLLRKDFIIDERQILQAIEWGADAILLIVAILTDAQLQHFLALADGAGVAALVEVHDEEELERAVRSGARLLGINNRNLKTFHVDLGTTERLAAHISDRSNYLLVAESGIHTRADVVRVRDAGARAILVGEALMKAESIVIRTAELIGN